MQQVHEAVALTPLVYVIRPAAEQDIAQIVQLVEVHAREGHLLPRDAVEVQATLANWVVALQADQVVGIGSLVQMNPQLVEVRSLAVLPAHRSSGIGGHVVQLLVQLAQQRGFTTIFALTRAVRFFTRLGWTITDKERFPEKVWRDCVKCPLVTCCDETAVVFGGETATPSVE